MGKRYSRYLCIIIGIALNKSRNKFKEAGKKMIEKTGYPRSQELNSLE